MLIIIKKENNHVIGKFSSDQDFEDIYKGNDYALANLTGIHVDDKTIPVDNLMNYKLVDGQFIKLTTEELPQSTPNQTQTEITSLKKENEYLKQELLETQQAIGELSMLITTPTV